MLKDNAEFYNLMEAFDGVEKKQATPNRFLGGICSQTAPLSESEMTALKIAPSILVQEAPEIISFIVDTFGNTIEFQRSWFKDHIKNLSSLSEKLDFSDGLLKTPATEAEWRAVRCLNFILHNIYS